MKKPTKLRIWYDAFRELLSNGYCYTSKAEEYFKEAEKSREIGDMYRGKMYRQQDLNRNTADQVATIERHCAKAVDSIERLAQYFLSNAHLEKQKNNLIKRMTPNAYS